MSKVGVGGGGCWGSVFMKFAIAVLTHPKTTH